MCPRLLRKNIFTIAAIDNINHNPSSTSSESLFHDTGISLFQHITEEEPGVVKHKKSIHLSQLPSIYADIIPISVFNRVPPISDNYSALQSNETFATGEKDRHILKLFSFLPTVLFQLFEILPKVLKKFLVN